MRCVRDRGKGGDFADSMAFQLPGLEEVGRVGLEVPRVRLEYLDDVIVSVPCCTRC